MINLQNTSHRLQPTPGNPSATPSVLLALEAASQHPVEFLSRRVSGDWGELDDEDKQDNAFSLENGFRLFSSYRTRMGEKLWVITEANRSVTTLLLPAEY